MTPEDRLIGEVFQGQRGRYTLQRLLGAGLTAWVFEGQAELEGSDPFPAAIKVMKPGLGAEEQRRFRAEAEHLAALLSARADAAPVYYEAFATGRADAPEALVLELMTGQKVEKLLEREGPFPEREGVALAVQLTGLLHTLHDQLRRTYTDFKFENLWWQREARTLKVTDWNVLSAPGDLSRVHVDLLRAARYVYTMLTGGEAQERGGRVITPFMRHPGWAQLSRATQGVLRRALHYNPEQRFKTASEMLKAWQKVQSFWEQDPARLWPEVEDLIGESYHRESYEKAREILDVLRRRLDAGDAAFRNDDAARLERLEAQVQQELNKEQTWLERGRHLFRGFSYVEAQNLFTRAQEDDPWNPVAWRWREAARVAHATTGFDRLVEDAMRGLDALDAGEHARAEDILRRLLPSAPGLDRLLREARARRLRAEAEGWAAEAQRLVEAGQGDTPEADAAFTKAQNAYQEAADALNGVTPEDFRRWLLEDLGDLAAQGRAFADARRSAAAQAGRKLREAEAAASVGDWDAAWRHLTAGLAAVPAERRLVDAAFRYGRARLLAGDLSRATDFLGLVIRQTPEAEEPRAWYRAATGASGVAAVLRAGEWREALALTTAALNLTAPAEAQAAAAEAMATAWHEALQRPGSAPDLAALRQGIEALARCAQVVPRLQPQADTALQQWPSLATAWITDHAGAWENATLVRQVEQALALTASEAQRKELASAFLPLVRGRLEQGTRWQDTPAAAELAALARRMRAVTSSVGPEPTWITVEQVRLVRADLEAELAAGRPLEAARQALAAVSSAPEAAQAALLERLGDLLRCAQEMTAPAADPAAARELLAVLEAVAEAAPEKAAEAWRHDLRAYRDTVEREEQERRRRAQERSLQRIESLLADGTPEALAEAEEEIGAALALTAPDSEHYRSLQALGERLRQRREGRTTLAEYRQRVEAFLGRFPAELGGARSDEDFQRLSQALAEAADWARQTYDSALIARCSAAKDQLEGVRAQRPEAARLEAEIAHLRSLERQLADKPELPGGWLARQGLWDRIGEAADKLLKLHPHHSDAAQALEAKAAFQQSRGLDERLAAFRGLRQELGPDLDLLDKAEAAWRAAQPEVALERIGRLRPEWRGQAENLRLRAEQGMRFLQEAERLKGLPVPSAEFDAALRSLLDQTVPEAYWQKAGVAQWLLERRQETLSRLQTPGQLKRDQIPAVLARLAAIDQSWRRLDAGRQGAELQSLTVPVETTHPTKRFVYQALRLIENRKTATASDWSQALAELPLTGQPSELAKAVQQAVEIAMQDNQDHQRRRLVVLAGLGIAGALLLASLAALAAWVWPGLAEDSRPNLIAALDTATVEAARPRVTVIRQQMTVVVTPTPLPPTPTPVPTFTPTPEPTAAPTQEPTPEPISTPMPAYSDPVRISQVLEGLQKFYTLTGTALANTVPISVTDVVAVVDDADTEGMLLLSTGVITTTVLPTRTNSITVATPGLLGGMRYFDLRNTNPANYPVFVWPPVVIADPGVYRLLIHVPSQHGTMMVGYRAELTGADGATMMLRINDLDEVPLDQSRFSDQWVMLGELRLDAASSLKVSARPLRPDARIGTAPAAAGFDAIAIVRVRPAGSGTQ